MKTLLVSLLLLTGCATSAGPIVDSGCPPGTTRINDEDTGMYDCAREEQYEELRDFMDERG